MHLILILEMAELQWALVKKWNRYQVHSGNYVLTSEPGNLYNRPFPQFSGIVHHGALNIQSAKDGKGITVSMVRFFKMVLLSFAENYENPIIIYE